MSNKFFRFILIIVGVIIFFTGLYFLKPLFDLGSERIPIGDAAKLEDRSVRLNSFWSDDELVAELLKTGVIDNTNLSNTVWIASVTIKNLTYENISVRPADFVLTGNDDKKYKVKTYDLHSGELKPEQESSGQLAFVIPKSVSAHKLIYELKDNENDKAVFSVGK